jgi:hypothetical protein
VQRLAANVNFMVRDLRRLLGLILGVFAIFFRITPVMLGLIRRTGRGSWGGTVTTVSLLGIALLNKGTN